MPPSFVLSVKNNLDDEVQSVELFDPSEQIDKNGEPITGVTVKCPTVGASYKRLLYELISQRKDVRLTVITGINEEKPLEFLQIHETNSSGIMMSRPLIFDEKPKQEENEEKQEDKTMAQITKNYSITVNTSIIIPFILPKQELKLYFYN